MKSKALLLSPILFFWHTFLFGQSSQVIPPSPITREFTKYINQEVSLYNGIPEINIPLYSIQLKGLTIPVNLSYHASGIKYAQEDGNVGVGWILNPGYRVSRNIHGHADEVATMPTDFSSTLSNFENNAGSAAGKVDRDRYLSKFVPASDFIYGGDLDGEFDQFTFSTPTTAGGFIILDRSNKSIATTEESNLLIDYNTGQTMCSGLNGIKGFQIIDERGNKYAFGEYNTQTQCNLETASAYYGGSVATAWGVSEITTPTGDDVQFIYERRAAGEFTTHARSFTVSVSGAGENCDVVPDENISTGHGYYTFYPNQIISPNETVSFQYNHQGILSKIEIHSSRGKNLRSIEFFYSDDTRHTFLDHITISDGHQNTIETYRFEYYAKNTTQAFTHDHYGNYLPTDIDPVPFYHQEFLDDPIYLTTECGFNQGTMNSYLAGLTISREPDNENAIPNYFSLKKITYPTGGFTEFEYEHGKYRAVGDSGPVRNSGIRIKSIKSFNLVTQMPLIKRYTYGIDQNGYGYAHAWIHNLEALFVKETTSIIPNAVVDESKTRRIISYSSSMQGDIGAVFSQSGFVKYPCVTEYYSSTAASQTGKTVYYFDVGHLFDIGTLPVRNINNGEVYNGSPYYVYRYRLWDKPLLKRKVVHSYSDEQYVPVQEEIFDYDETANTYTGLIVEQSVTNGGDGLTNEVYPSFLDRYFNYGEYSIEIGRNFLKHKTEHQYLHGNTITTNYSYDYSNLLISKETMARSNGGSTVTYTSYPLDYAPGTDFINDMMDNHLLAYPIEQIKYLDDGTNRTILAGQITKYKTGGKGLRDEELALETSSPITLSSFTFSNLAIGVLPPNGIHTTFSPDNHYKLRLNYDAYDLKGNILSVSKENDIETCFIWGYNHTYPVAKIVGSDYNSAYNLLTQAEKSALIDPISDQQVRSIIEKIRDHSSMVGAMVYGYTYSPLIGMTSSTDANGIVTYFEYDEFQRLRTIKDNEGNVLKRHYYHYASGIPTN